MMDASEDIVKNVIEIRESLKISDQRLTQLKDNIRLVDQNNLEKYNEMKETIQALQAKVATDNTKLIELEDLMSRLQKQLQQYAKVQDVKMLDKYLSFIDPSRFLNKEDVLKIVDEYMSSKKWT